MAHRAANLGQKKAAQMDGLKCLGIFDVDVFDSGVWEPSGLTAGCFDLDPGVGLSEDFYGETGFERCG